MHTTYIYIAICMDAFGSIKKWHFDNLPKSWSRIKLLDWYIVFIQVTVINVTSVGLSLLSSKIYLLFLPKFLKYFPYYSYLFSYHYLLFL